MAGQFGDIDWTRIDPKTWELRNRVPSQATTPSSTTTSTTLPTQMFDEYQQQRADTYAPAAPSQAAQRHMWRTQFKNFDKTLRKDDPARYTDNAVQGIQELLDSGAIWFDTEGGVYGALEHHPGGKKGTERLLDATREWNKWQDEQTAQKLANPDDPDRLKMMQDMAAGLLPYNAP